MSPRASGAAPNFGWAVYEGAAYDADSGSPATAAVGPIAIYSHGDGRSVTGGYVYRGKACPALAAVLLRRLLLGTIWSLKIVGGKATACGREPFKLGRPVVVRRGRARRAVRRHARRHGLPALASS